MMNDTRLNVMRHSCVPLLVWGWVSSAVSITVYLGLILTGNPNWNFAWFLIPVVGLPVLRRVRPREKGMQTAISHSLLTIWKMLTVVILTLSVSSFVVRFQVLAMILLLLAIGSFITGELIRFSFLKYSSIPGFILAAVLWVVSGPTAIPIFGAAMLVMMVLPAYKIKYELRDERA
ncbi:MAG: hypothetical protein NC212_10340 [Staphylococcus sp.]|nr:hypothetical protein [Staphylococcus sp.]